MNRGIIIKAMCETWRGTLLFGFGLMVVEAVLAYVLPTYQAQFSAQMLEVPFIATLIKAMVGIDVAGAGSMVFNSIPWVHPVVLAIIWAHAVIFCTRVPAGEVDRGTIDILLSLPVSRRTVFLSESFVFVASALLVLCLGAAGNFFGNMNLPASTRMDYSHVPVVLVNLLLLSLSVAGMSWFIGACSNRRGLAIAIAFSCVLASFLLNFLAQFWAPADQIAFLSGLRYYRPLFILRDGHWPLRDLAVLGSTAFMLWMGAGIIFARRDLMTV